MTNIKQKEEEIINKRYYLSDTEEFIRDDLDEYKQLIRNETRNEVIDECQNYLMTADIPNGLNLSALKENHE